MNKSGYDQFFKTAQKVASQGHRSLGNQQRKQNLTGHREPNAGTKQTGEELRRRMSAQTKKKSNRAFPWKMASLSMMGLCVALLGLWKIEDIEKIVRSVEISMLGAAHAEEKAPAGASPAGSEAKPGVTTSPAPEGGAPVNEAQSGGAKEYSSEEINHLSKLNDRKRELDAREEELNRMEAELALQKTELEKRLTELESTRRNISSVLEEKVQADDKKVEKLVEMYSNMKPQQAAKVFEEMDEGLAIEILGRMKKKNVAEIMSLVKSEKVRVLSEKFAGYKRN